MNRAKRVEYDTYLRSPVWAAKRYEALSRAGDRCQLCNRGDNLDVHHRTYERFGGGEIPADLTVLCRRCHQLFHAVNRPSRDLERARHRDRLRRQRDRLRRLLYQAKAIYEANDGVGPSTPEMEGQLSARLTELVACGLFTRDGHRFEGLRPTPVYGANGLEGFYAPGEPLWETELCKGHSYRVA